jgi:hypothetical protein
MPPSQEKPLARSASATQFPLLQTFRLHSVPPLQNCSSFLAAAWQEPPRHTIAKQSPDSPHVGSPSTSRYWHTLFWQNPTWHSRGSHSRGAPVEKQVPLSPQMPEKQVSDGVQGPPAAAAQAPRLPATLHAWQVPQAATLQQTPFVQKPERH